MNKTLLLLLLGLLFITNVECFGLSSPSKAYVDEFYLKNVSSVPVVKMPIYYSHFVYAKIGNLVKHVSLEVSYECGKETVVLFDFNEDISRTYTTSPNSLILYIGNVMVRVPFSVNPFMRKKVYDIPYHGILCVGKESSLWNYWTKMSLSKHRMILGQFDKSIARMSYQPYELAFTNNLPHNVSISGHIYPLIYDPSCRVSKLPKDIYHNISGLKIQIENIIFDVDNDDIKARVINGFDHTLIGRSEDNTITLGQQFFHNFAHYNDFAKNVMTVLPSFDHFAKNNAEEYYVWTCVGIYTVIFLQWIAKIYTLQNKKSNMNSLLGKSLEIYTFLTSILIAYIDIFGFKNQRNINFILDTIHNVKYALLYSFIVTNSVVGIFATLFNVKLSTRRLFFESTVFATIWTLLTHLDLRLSTFILLFIVSCIACIIRTTHFLLACSFKNITSGYCMFTLGFTVLSNLFVWFYSLHSLVVHFYYGFEDSSLFSLFVMLIFNYLPILMLFVNFPLATFRNTLIEIYDSLKINDESQSKKYSVKLYQ